VTANRSSGSGRLPAISPPWARSCDRPQRRHDSLEDSVRRVSRARGQGLTNTGSDNYGARSSRQRAALHRRTNFDKNSTSTTSSPASCCGNDAPRGGQCDAVDLRDQRARVRRDRVRRGKTRAVWQQHRRFRVAAVIRRLWVGPGSDPVDPSDPGPTRLLACVLLRSARCKTSAVVSTTIGLILTVAVPAWLLPPGRERSPISSPRLVRRVASRDTGRAGRR